MAPFWDKASIVAWVALIVFTIVILGFRRFEKHPARDAWIAALLILSVVVCEFAIGPSNEMWVTIWLFTTGISTPIVLDSFRRERILENRWEVVLVIALTVLTGYAGSVYPHVKSAFGGGVPAQVTVYFRDKASLAGERQVLETNLLDENEHGFYVTPARDSKLAYFVSRDQVAYIKFQPREP